MGGRPTRPIRPTPPWTKVPIDGETWYRYAERYEELFYDSRYGSESGPNNSLTEVDFIRGHWRQERGRCIEKLRRWQDFLDTQQWRRDRRSEFVREEDMERQRYPQDLDLTASLKKLKDWKKYQGYFQRWNRPTYADNWRSPTSDEGNTTVQRKNPEVTVNKGTVCERTDEGWLRTTQEQRKKLAVEEKRLKWVKKQLPAILSKCAALLTKLPISHH